MTIQTASGRAPIGIQRRMMEIGRIRFGDVVAGRGSRPRALDKFRLTSASREVLEAAAAIYGAAKPVREWKDAPNPGTFELYTDSTELDVVLPPVQSALDGSATYPYSQAWELWDGPTCARRCDGEVAVVPKGRALADVACICQEQRGTGPTFCEIRTRISVMLPQLPGLGLWRMDTGGMYAAAYLPGTLQLLAMAAARGRYLPCKLRLEHRSSKRPNDKGEIETHRFVVPVLDPGITPGELMAMTGPETVNVPQIGNGEKPALPPPAERPAAPLEKEGASLGARTPLPTSAPLTAPDEDEPPDPPAAATGGEDAWMKAIHAIGREKGLDHDGIRLVATGFFGADVFPADRSLTDLNPLERGKLRKALDDMKPAANEQQPQGTESRDAARGGGTPPLPAAADQPVPEVFPDSPPVRLPPAPADPELAVERAVYTAAQSHGIVTPGMDATAAWAAIDDVASSAFNKEAAELSPDEWREFAVRTSAGEWDAPAEPPARPRKVTA